MEAPGRTHRDDDLVRIRSNRSLLLLFGLLVLAAVGAGVAHSSDRDYVAAPDQRAADRALTAFYDWCRYPRKRTDTRERDLRREISTYGRLASVEPDRWLNSYFAANADITLKKGLAIWTGYFADHDCPGGKPYSTLLRRAGGDL